jgi:hypothetical protein
LGFFHWWDVLERTAWNSLPLVAPFNPSFSAGFDSPAIPGSATACASEHRTFFGQIYAKPAADTELVDKLIAKRVLPHLLKPLAKLSQKTQGQPSDFSSILGPFQPKLLWIKNRRKSLRRCRF